MNTFRFALPTAADWRWRLLRRAEAQFDTLVYLNNNGIAYPNGPFPNRLYAGAKRVVPFTGWDDLGTLSAFHQRHRCHLVGYVGYDVKNQLEALESRHPNRLGFPDCWFFEPVYIVDFEDDAIIVQTHEPNADGWQSWLEDHSPRAVCQPVAVPSSSTPRPPFAIHASVSESRYVEVVQQIRSLIEVGDVYELNYCIEFSAEQVQLDPVAAYQHLCALSPMPFSTYLKEQHRYVLGASPERFLKRNGDRLLSQPIKGTIRRGKTPHEDEALKTQLRQSEKEQAENLMIVDLVRNDLARSAQTGTVRVDELFGLYSFQQVHQLISTVSATARPGATLAEVLGNAFPMGSMTGAPKIRAMQRIEELETSRRGVFSGAVGYVLPSGDFDFNVVIRSLFYNAEMQRGSYLVGSAITYDADPAQEYAECLLKGQALHTVLSERRL
jgi:para-aminobenzoate synthetase component I